jgi:hypothetical protein
MEWFDFLKKVFPELRYKLFLVYIVPVSTSWHLISIQGLWEFLLSHPKRKKKQMK